MNLGGGRDPRRQGARSPRPPPAAHKPAVKRSFLGTTSGGLGEGDGTMSWISDAPPHAPEKQPRAAPAGSEGSSSEAVPEKQDEDLPSAPLEESWQSSQFQIRRLEGHSDLVTAVLFHGSRLISGSRDTTVKVWHVPTASEERNLGGHTGEVTCLASLPEELGPRLDCVRGESLVASGSADSCILVWALLAGTAVRHVYTFHPVTALRYLPGAELLISGSGGGKVQLCDPVSQEGKQSVRAHSDSVTDIQVEADRVFTASRDGEVKVRECRRDRRLHLLYASGWDGRRLGPILTLAVHDEAVYLGGEGSNLKVLKWTKGTLGKLANHLSGGGVTDCLAVAGDVLVVSGFNAELGLGHLNVRRIPDSAYLGTVTCEGLPRILCLAAWRTTSGFHRWATGGKVLLVWEQLGPEGQSSSALRVSRYPSYDREAADSDSEGASETSDGEAGSPGARPRRESGPEGEGSRLSTSWCRLA